MFYSLDESMFSYRVELRLELDIELNLLDTKTPEYTTLFQSILKAVCNIIFTLVNARFCNILSLANLYNEKILSLCSWM